ncbi:hypothetical protein [Tenacibaculum sp. 190524A05c]|uniref:hypothetical protein n=1 Tax=Tenacibaculum platacis TaxID=3137852 RepID=UPI0031FADB20
MKTTIKFISYFLLLFVCIGCNEDKNEELITDKEDDKIDIQQSSRAFRPKRTLKRRLKIKRILQESWRITTRIPNIEENSDIAIIEMTISSGEKSMLVELHPVKENAKFIKFKSELIKVSKDFIGTELMLVSIDKNEKGEQIGEPFIETTKVPFVPFNEAVSINQPKLSLNKDGETFTMSVALKGDPKLKYLKLEMKEIMISSKVVPDDGGSETVEDAITLQYVGQNEEGLFIFENQYVEFIESDNVVDMEYLSSITISDTGGEELDYAEFRITGLE